MGATTSIAERLAVARERVDAAELRAGRPGEVRLVAVSKSAPANLILECYAAGQRLFAENRVQEAAAKLFELRPHMANAEWHLVGHLQRNKARPALDYFHLIESVDTLDLAIRLDRLAGESRRQEPILLEVNVAQERSKWGFAPADLGASVERLLRLDHLTIRGLMTVAPAAPDPEAVRWVFRALRRLRDEAQRHWGAEAMTELSMGMSADFEVAVEEGATMVRIGTAIFGVRPPTPGGLPG